MSNQTTVTSAQADSATRDTKARYDSLKYDMGKAKPVNGPSQGGL